MLNIFDNPYIDFVVNILGFYIFSIIVKFIFNDEILEREEDDTKDIHIEIHDHDLNRLSIRCHNKRQNMDFNYLVYFDGVKSYGCWINDKYLNNDNLFTLIMLSIVMKYYEYNDYPTFSIVYNQSIISDHHHDIVKQHLEQFIQ